MKGYLKNLKIHFKTLLLVNTLMLFVYLLQFVVSRFFTPLFAYTPFIDAIILTLCINIFFLGAVHSTSTLSLKESFGIIWAKALLFSIMVFLTLSLCIIAFRFFIGFEQLFGFIMASLVLGLFLFFFALFSQLAVILSIHRQASFSENLISALTYTVAHPERSAGLLCISMLFLILSAVSFFIFPGFFGIYLVWYTAYQHDF